jgi:hypothetical protein
MDIKLTGYAQEWWDAEREHNRRLIELLSKRTSKDDKIADDDDTVGKKDRDQPEGTQ